MYGSDVEGKVLSGAVVISSDVGSAFVVAEVETSRTMGGSFVSWGTVYGSDVRGRVLSGAAVFPNDVGAAVDFRTTNSASVRELVVAERVVVTIVVTTEGPTEIENNIHLGHIYDI